MLQILRISRLIDRQVINIADMRDLNSDFP